MKKFTFRKLVPPPPPPPAPPLPPLPEGGLDISDRHWGLIDITLVNASPQRIHIFERPHTAINGDNIYVHLNGVVNRFTGLLAGTYYGVVIYPNGSFRFLFAPPGIG